MADKIWVHCNICSGKKKHDLLCHEEVKWSEEISEHFSIQGSNVYDLLKCCGCDSVVLRHNSWSSEDYDPETGKPEVYTRYYPPPTYRNLPRWVHQFGLFSKSEESISELMHEINVALQNNAPQLATMGIRALLEIVMIDKVGDKGSFSANIKAFKEAGYISSKQEEVIKPILEAGHAAMHRGYKPDKQDVVQLMDVTESIIETIYINESKIQSLTSKIPSRPPKQKKG